MRTQPARLCRTLGVPVMLGMLGLIITAAPPGARGAEYVVDGAHPSASDGNPGTTQAPFATIQHGADVAEAGDLVIVRGGYYPERVRLTRSGEPGLPILLRSEPRRAAMMHGFTVADASHVGIEGFDITSSPLFTGWDETAGFFVRGNHVEIVDNDLHDVSSTGIVGYWHEPYPEDVVVRGNTLYRVQMGITISGRRWLVEGNEVSRLFQYGEGDCDYSRFFGEDHVIRRNLFHGTDFDEIGDAHVDCFQTFTNNGEETRNILFEGNVCFDFHQALMASNEAGTDTHHFTFRSNLLAHGHAWGLCVHDVSYILVENNTFADIAYHGAGFRGASLGNVIRNNIFYGMSSSYWADEGGEVSGDYNLVFDAGEPGSPGANDLLDVDPGFADPENDDFHLLPDSEAVDAGTAIAEVTTDLDGLPRPQGAGWDLGAFEHSDAQPVTIVTWTLPTGVPDVAYLALLRARGGTPPYTWSLSRGALPPGLTLDPATGTLGGTPTEAGMYSFEAAVEDTALQTDVRTLSITILEEHGRGDAGCGCRGAPSPGTPDGGPISGLPWLGFGLVLGLWLKLGPKLGPKLRLRLRPRSRPGLRPRPSP